MPDALQTKCGKGFVFLVIADPLLVCPLETSLMFFNIQHIQNNLYQIKDASAMDVLQKFPLPLPASSYTQLNDAAMKIVQPD